MRLPARHGMCLAFLLSTISLPTTLHCLSRLHLLNRNRDNIFAAHFEQWSIAESLLIICLSDLRPTNRLRAARFSVAMEPAPHVVRLALRRAMASWLPWPCSTHLPSQLLPESVLPLLEMISVDVLQRLMLTCQPPPLHCTSPTRAIIATALVPGPPRCLYPSIDAPLYCLCLVVPSLPT